MKYTKKEQMVASVIPDIVKYGINVSEICYIGNLANCMAYRVFHRPTSVNIISIKTVVKAVEEIVQLRKSGMKRIYRNPQARCARKKLGLTSHSAADLSGIHIKAIDNIEIGYSPKTDLAQLQEEEYISFLQDRLSSKGIPWPTKSEALSWFIVHGDRGRFVRYWTDRLEMLSKLLLADKELTKNPLKEVRVSCVPESPTEWFGPCFENKADDAKPEDVKISAPETPPPPKSKKSSSPNMAKTCKRCDNGILWSPNDGKPYACPICGGSGTIG